MIKLLGNTTAIKSRGIIIGLMLTVAGLLTGCGGGGGDATASVTKEEFVNRANAICKSQAEQREDALAEFNKNLKSRQTPPSHAEERKYLKTVVLPSYHQMTQELGALNPPKEDAERVEAFIRELETAVKKMSHNYFNKNLSNAMEMAETYGIKCG